MTGGSEPLLEGTLISHLLELRTRLMRAFLGVMLVFIPFAFYSNHLFEWLSHPLLQQLPPNSTLISTSIIAPFTAPLKLAFIAALVVAMPYVLYELWAFIAPGLYRHEKSFAVPLLVSAVILFYVGIAFAYYVVFPLIFNFFVNTTPRGVQLMADISMYMDFVLVLAFSFGIAFEVPVAVVLLVLMGIVPLEKLTQIRGYVLIGVFIIAAILTPPDALSQTVMAVPMYLLYEGGILMARMMMRSRARAEKPAAGENE
ncbi:MAG TPA: twin-arginine translocase subunit TatC [Steroidobacteraceae bacterium]|nr:twin-arginine translocase subunit TatC [Steroidobacteraceae bacterium]